MELFFAINNEVIELESKVPKNVFTPGLEIDLIEK
jgi:hypothetical protein